MTGVEVNADMTRTEPPGSLLVDVASLFLRPSALFDSLPVVNRAPAALLVLLCLHVLYGVAYLATGVLDYEIDYVNQKAVGRFRDQLQGDENAAKRVSELDLMEKGAGFNKTIARLALLGGGPVRVLAGCGLLGGLLYTVVALRGGKPNYSLLFGVVVFASYVEVPRLALRLALVAGRGETRVETSAAACVSDPSVGLPMYVMLRRLDPFDVWFFGLVAFGVCRTGQLTPRAAVVAVCLLWLLTATWNAAGDVAELAHVQISMGGSANVDDD